MRIRPIGLLTAVLLSLSGIHFVMSTIHSGHSAADATVLGCPPRSPNGCPPPSLPTVPPTTPPVATPTAAPPPVPVKPTRVVLPARPHPPARVVPRTPARAPARVLAVAPSRPTPTSPPVPVRGTPVRPVRYVAIPPSAPSAAHTSAFDYPAVDLALVLLVAAGAAIAGAKSASTPASQDLQQNLRGVEAFPEGPQQNRSRDARDDREH